MVTPPGSHDHRSHHDAGALTPLPTVVLPLHPDRAAATSVLLHFGNRDVVVIGQRAQRESLYATGLRNRAVLERQVRSSPAYARQKALQTVLANILTLPLG